MTDSIDRALGKVEGKLDSLHSRLDDIDNRLAKIEATAAEAKIAATQANGWIEKTTPFVDNLSKWQQRGIGVWLFTMFFTAMIASVFTTFKAQILRFFGVTP